MSQIASFREIIEIWPTREALASEIGCPASTVSKWWQRNSIPSEWWTRLLALPAAAELSADTLADLASRDREVA